MSGNVTEEAANSGRDSQPWSGRRMALAIVVSFALYLQAAYLTYQLLLSVIISLSSSPTPTTLLTLTLVSLLPQLLWLGWLVLVGLLLAHKGGRRTRRALPVVFAILGTIATAPVALTLGVLVLQLWFYRSLAPDQQPDPAVSSASVVIFGLAALLALGCGWIAARWGMTIRDADRPSLDPGSAGPSTPSGTS